MKKRAVISFSQQRADMAAVRTKLESMVAQGRAVEALEAALSLVTDLRDENNQLTARMHGLLRKLYGRSSERVSSRQLQLMLAMLGVEDGEAPPPVTIPPVDPPPARPKGKKKGKKPFPENLERERVDIPVPEEERPCPTCGGQREGCGHEVVELIEFVPAKFKVIEERREKLVCRQCEELTTAPMGERMIEGGRPGPCLLAHICVSKYQDSCPLNRMADIYKRYGVEFATSTLSDWVGSVTEILEPIALRIAARVLASRYIRADDTGLKVLDRDSPHGIKKGHMWAYVGDNELVAFTYTPTWRADEPNGPLNFLQDFEGYLQADGYAGYEPLYQRADPLVIEVGCHMHSRRKFEAAMDAGEMRAALAMNLYRKLYEVERICKEQGLSHAERRARRLEQSHPLLLELKAWIDELHPTLLPSSLLLKATTYARNQWAALVRYLEDGRLEMDNGAVERALRVVALGRKNYLFAGSEAGAERAAIAYTVLASARLHGLDPFAYLVDIMKRLQSGFPFARIDELLPDAWAKNHAEQANAEKVVPAIVS